MTGIPLQSSIRIPLGDVVSIDGEVFALADHEDGYTISTKVEHPTWVECEVGTTVRSETLQAQILLGDWEGEGCLRLASESTEILLHFDTSGPFESIQLHANVLHAQVEEYPNPKRYEIHFQLGNRNEIRIQKIK
ncbi:MAG TPA: hypothetical protein PKO15_17140 [Fibrobacteria bacterium]|nr:hypothetical protein [Fibrobacteria bacterium]HOX50864.1 hypothetical protein [Fibrobacteria bacterium]